MLKKPLVTLALFALLVSCSAVVKQNGSLDTRKSLTSRLRAMIDAPTTPSVTTMEGALPSPPKILPELTGITVTRWLKCGVPTMQLLNAKGEFMLVVSKFGKPRHFATVYADIVFEKRMGVITIYRTGEVPHSACSTAILTYQEATL